MGKIEKLTKEGWKKLADKNYKQKMGKYAKKDLKKAGGK